MDDRLRPLSGSALPGRPAGPDEPLRTALIVAVPEVAPAVDEWRERTAAAKPSAGVPAHVTILFPFVAPSSVTAPLLAELRSLFGAFPGFRLTLEETARFESVLYLVPRPAEPFVRMTEAVRHAFPEYPPYGGSVDAIVPHLTVAEGDPGLLDEAEAGVRPALPITAHVSTVVLLEEVEPDLARWRAGASLPLGRV